MTGSFVVEVQDLTHLKKVMKSIRRVAGVIGVAEGEWYRLVTPGSLRAACPTTTAWWGGCPWRSTTKRTG